jgi:hypothetical protein
MRKKLIERVSARADGTYAFATYNSKGHVISLRGSYKSLEAIADHARSRMFIKEQKERFKAILEQHRLTKP